MLPSAVSVSSGVTPLMLSGALVTGRWADLHLQAYHNFFCGVAKMTMTFALLGVFFFSALYAVALNTGFGKHFADKYAWLAFSLGELIIIAAVAVLSNVNAVELFLLNAAGALPMVLRWAWLDIASTSRKGLRAIYEETSTMAGERRASQD